MRVSAVLSKAGFIGWPPRKLVVSHLVPYQFYSSFRKNPGCKEAQAVVAESSVLDALHSIVYWMTLLVLAPAIYVGSLLSAHPGYLVLVSLLALLPPFGYAALVLTLGSPFKRLLYPRLYLHYGSAVNSAVAQLQKTQQQATPSLLIDQVRMALAAKEKIEAETITAEYIAGRLRKELKSPVEAENGRRRPFAVILSAILDELDLPTEVLEELKGRIAQGDYLDLNSCSPVFSVILEQMREMMSEEEITEQRRAAFEFLTSSGAGDK